MFYCEPLRKVEGTVAGIEETSAAIESVGVKTGDAKQGVRLLVELISSFRFVR